jgi:DNA processing protein
VSPGGPRWVPARDLPAAFGELSHPPAGLWCHGDADDLLGAPARHVAIVGTREASSYGVRTATRLATACAKAGLVVVSGLARGVDAAAHEAALRAGGRTVAVLGTGIDVPYPVGHRALMATIARQGLVVSESEPGTLARAGCFPRRNRLIAALCRVTVVVEAGFKSGAINTAGQALELGRTVAAVPGQIDDPRAAGANGLCRDGAQVICSVEDLLSLFDLSTMPGLEGSPANGVRSGSDETSTRFHRAGFEPSELGESGAFGALSPSVDGLSVRQASFRRLARELAEAGGGEGGSPR